MKYEQGELSSIGCNISKPQVQREAKTLTLALHITLEGERVLQGREEEGGRKIVVREGERS